MTAVITVLGFDTTSSGASRRVWVNGSAPSVVAAVNHPHGANLAVWDLTDPTAMVLLSTTSLSALIFVGRGAPATSNSYAAIDSGSVTAWEESVGGVTDGPFVPHASNTATFPVSCGCNQFADGVNGDAFFVADGSDIAIVRFAGGGPPPAAYPTPASVALGEAVAGMCGDISPGLTAAGGNTVKRWTIAEDASTPHVATFTLAWTAATAEGSARNCHTDQVTLVAVVTGSGASSAVELFDLATGAPIGVYTNPLGGTIVDCIFAFTPRLVIITDDSVNNCHVVDITNPALPVFETSKSVPVAGHTLSAIDYGNGSTFIVTGNVVAGGAASITVIQIDEAAPVSSAFASCFSLGSFLFVADNSGSALKIYDLSDPTAPTLTASLDLDNPPTDVVLLDTMAYLIAGDTIYGVNIDVIDAPEQVIEKTDVSGDFLLNAGGNLWASGATTGLRVFSVDKGEDGLTIEKYLPPPSTGVSRVAFAQERLILVDVPDTETALLRSYKFGGLTCHNVNAGHVGAHETDSETLRARIGDIKQLSANAVEVTGTPGGGFDGYVKLGNKYIAACTGSPEGAVMAPPGSVALSDSGAVYRKDSGTGNTGWTAI